MAGATIFIIAQVNKIMYGKRMWQEAGQIKGIKRSLTTRVPKQPAHSSLLVVMRPVVSITALIPLTLILRDTKIQVRQALVIIVIPIAGALGFGGVRLIKLGKDDFVVGADIVKKDNKEGSLLVITENGYGKRSDLSDYKVQNRGGSGIKTVKVTPKTGKLIGSKVVISKDSEEIIAISKKSQVIRLSMTDVPELGRQTQGVRLMKMREGDFIASLTCL